MPDSPLHTSTEHTEILSAPRRICSFSWLTSSIFWSHLIPAFLLPRWYVRARDILKGGRRYLNYKIDIMPEEEAVELYMRIHDLETALGKRDRKSSEEAAGKLESMVDAMPGSKLSAIAENAEVFFVILAIFLGIRCYIAQPFRIPTGSMQPSLNGIIIEPCKEEPSFLQKASGMVLRGSSYIHEVANDRKAITGYKQGTKFLLFTRTTVFFDNGSTIEIPSAQGEVQRYFEATKGSFTPSFSPGETIIQANCNAGDLIIVNKIAYNFRKPERGEVFVFDTVGIEGIQARSGDQAKGTHYVKRLCGLPGDTLSIQTPLLMIDGKNAQSWTIQRVENRKPPYNPYGYIPASPEAPGRRLVRMTPGEQQDRFDPKGYRSIPITFRQYMGPGESLTLRNPSQNPIMRQYAALGDNTTNSLDSRYWGPVHQYNIIGPATIALWPFTAHWGLIP